MNSAPAPQLDQETASETGEGQYLTFMLAGEEYAIDILKVQGIQGWDRITDIPNTPDFILGVINLRGTVVPIIDLRRRFKLESIPFGPMTVVIIVRVEDQATARTVGIVVDAVSEVYNLAAAQIRPAPDFGAAVDTDFVKGLATVEEHMVILLDIDTLINAGILEVINEAAATE